MDDLTAAGIDGAVAAVITVIVADDISELDIASGYSYAAVITDSICTMRNIDLDLSVTVLNETGTVDALP